LTGTFWLLALCAQVEVLRRTGWDERSALLGSLAFVFGTNLYATCVRANVWAYGQSLGYCLAVIGLLSVTFNRKGAGPPGLGYLLLALAVGCRPLLAFVFPLFVALDHRTSGRSLPRALRSAVLWAGPIALGLASYNFVRFGSPLEFGHNYLPWAQGLSHGIFPSCHIVITGQEAIKPELAVGIGYGCEGGRILRIDWL
jgi:hypothetical protein